MTDPRSALMPEHILLLPTFLAQILNAWEVDQNEVRIVEARK
jgi:hypothetical protein